LIAFQHADQQATLVEAMEQHLARLSRLADSRRPGFTVVGLNDMELEAVGERKVIYRQPMRVGQLHDDAEQRVPVAGQMDGTRKRGPEIVDNLGRQTHAAVMDAADRFALTVADGR
jgi:hypothetical protein